MNKTQPAGAERYRHGSGKFEMKGNYATKMKGVKLKFEREMTLKFLTLIFALITAHMY